MNLEVRLFARARDLVGRDRVAVELPATATVADLRQALSRAYPLLSDLLARSALAVNDELACEDQPLPAGAEVALLPPVSGGAVPGMAAHDQGIRPVNQTTLGRPHSARGQDG